MAVREISSLGANVLGFKTSPAKPIIGTARPSAPTRPIIGTARMIPPHLLNLAVQRAVVGTHASDNTVLGPQLHGGGTGLPGQPSDGSASAAVVVDHPTLGPTAVAVPAPVAQAIQAGDPNAAAAVNAAYGGSPGGAATPTSASASGAVTEQSDVWGPRLFGLGIIAAGAVLVFVVGRHVK